MSESKKPFPWFGIVLIAFGIYFIVDEIYYLDFENFWELWPLIFIFWGINKFRQFQGDIALPSILVFIGVFLLMRNFDLLPYVISDNFWPITLILFGIYIIFENRQAYSKRDRVDDRDFLNITNVFGGSKLSFDTHNFKGGQTISVFGGGEIDLRSAKFMNDSVSIHVTVMFGGIDFYVPTDWNVVMNVVPIFGGIEDTRRPTAESVADAKTLVIKGVVVFGGVEIK